MIQIFYEISMVFLQVIQILAGEFHKILFSNETFFFHSEERNTIFHQEY